METLDLIAQDLVDLHPSDAANIISGMSVDDIVLILSSIGPERASKTLTRMATAVAAESLATMSIPEARAVIDSVSAPVAATLLRSCQSERIQSILSEASHPERIRELLQYPPGSVGEAMDAAIPTVPSHWRVDQVRKALHDLTTPACPYLYVTSESGALVGVLHILKLDSPGETPLPRLMDTPVVSLQAYSPLESVIDNPAWAHYDVLPVKSWTDVPVGMLRHKDLRRHDRTSARAGIAGESVAEVVLSLSELYWTGLWNVVEGFAPPSVRTTQRQDH
jgi:Mg/Co/Ni transporter MgtE